MKKRNNWNENHILGMFFFSAIFLVCWPFQLSRWGWCILRFALDAQIERNLSSCRDITYIHQHLGYLINIFIYYGHWSGYGLWILNEWMIVSLWQLKSVWRWQKCWFYILCVSRLLFLLLFWNSKLLCANMNKENSRIKKKDGNNRTIMVQFFEKHYHFW